MPCDVFISYSTKNIKETQLVLGALERAGLRCWIAPRDIPPGKTWGGSINRAIQNCIVFLLIVTDESNASDQVLNEVVLANQRKKPIVSFFLQKLELSDDLGYYLTALHWLHASTSPLESHLPELVEVIRNLLPGAPAQQTPAQSIAPVAPPKPTPPPEPPAGATRVREVDGMLEVYVPADEFLMGSDDGEDHEKPPHKVYLDAYWIDQTPVTNAMFARFAAQTGYRTQAEQEGSGWVFSPTKKAWEKTKGADWRHPLGPKSTTAMLDLHPVVQVSWQDALAYCEWAGGKLPTEAQWEKAARGTDGRKYPWGDNEPDSTLANYNLNVGSTTPVGSYPAGASPYGALDMAGNVWEWCADWYGEAYYAKSPPKNPTGPVSGEMRVGRGGSWDYVVRVLRAAFRYRGDPNSWFDVLGFRCCR